MKWKVLNQDTSRADIYTEKSGDKLESFIATVPSDKAGLIAAAPEMLDCLERVLASNFNDLKMSDIERMQDIIKKAKG